jgi:hypothetical protein
LKAAEYSKTADYQKMPGDAETATRSNLKRYAMGPEKRKCTTCPMR